MRTRLFLTAAATLALAACSGGNDTAEADRAAADTATASADSSAPAAPAAMNPQGFVDAASASDMFEIEAGKLAQSMGKSQGVKDFGAMMVKDHTKSSADLKAAAGQSEGVTVAPRLTAKQQSDLDALKAAGDSFDRTYKNQQIAAHTQALSLLQGQASGGTGPLKDFAAKTAPVVEGHLGEARQLP